MKELCKVDVLVVGGGPAGLAAAIASARAGAQTVLVEQFGYLGGTATASLMACINGFRNQVEPDGTQVVRGIAEEIVLELKKLGGLGKSPYPQKRYANEPGQLEYSYAVDTEMFKYVTLKMCVEAGVDLMFHTYCCDSIVDIALGGYPFGGVNRARGWDPFTSEGRCKAVSTVHAALRWVLACDDLDCTVPGMHSVEQIDELLATAERPFDDEDKAILETFKAALAESKAEVQLGADWN